MKLHGTKRLLIAGLAAAVISQAGASPKCPGDCDYDGNVGFTDFVTLLRDWDRTDPCVSDINEDGIVDFIDLTILLSKWGPCQTPESPPQRDFPLTPIDRQPA